MSAVTSAMTAEAMSSYLELRKNDWNDVVDDFSQCMRVSTQEEIEYLSSLNANLAEYLRIHPEMAHELMVPSGFKDRIPRRYERLLGGTKPLSLQTGLAEEAKRNGEILEGMMEGPLKVRNRPGKAIMPKWYEVVNHVHADDTEAAQFEHRVTGDLVRVFKFKDFQLQVTETDWRLMWDHVACQFTHLPFWDEVGLECVALHQALHELCAIPKQWNDWYWPTGQKIAICILQLEARLGALHRRNRVHKCCSNPEHHDSFGLGLKEFLTKEEAAACVIELRKNTGQSLEACNYDVVIMDLMNMKMGPGGCGNMILRDNSVPRSKAIFLSALDLSAQPVSTMPDKAKTPLASSSTNKKIKVEAIKRRSKVGNKKPTTSTASTSSTSVNNERKMGSSLCGNHNISGCDCGYNMVKMEEDTTMSG